MPGVSFITLALSTTPSSPLFMILRIIPPARFAIATDEDISLRMKGLLQVMVKREISSAQIEGFERPLSEKDWEIVSRIAPNDVRTYSRQIQNGGLVNSCYLTYWTSCETFARFSGIECPRMSNFFYLTFFRPIHSVFIEAAVESRTYL